MVSTRGIRYRFTEGERVLCYEPDPTKAKVLYDSKVLEVIETKDKRGRRTVEYLIHFQGWNSSWDRCVSEDFVLKDTEENRQLQRDLAEKSQLQLGAYLYRRERKKVPIISTAGPVPVKRARHGFSDDGSSTSTQPDDVEPQGGGDTDSSMGSCNSQASAQMQPSRVTITLPPALRDRLTFDYHLVVKRNRLNTLPASPSASDILESFVKWFARSGAWRPVRLAKPEPPQKPDFLDVCCRLNLVREVADGLRVYFDYILGDHLLYKQEMNQYHKFCGQYVIPDKIRVKEEKPISKEVQDLQTNSALVEDNIKSPKIPEYAHLPPDPSDGDKAAESPQSKEEPPSKSTESRKSSEERESVKSKEEIVKPIIVTRRLRSHKSAVSPPQVEEIVPASSTSEPRVSETQTSSVNGSIGSSESSLCSSWLPSQPKSPAPTTPTRTPLSLLLDKITKWQLIPNENTEHLPCRVYGAIHLARLFVKLPDFLNATPMPDMKLKLILKHVDMFIQYLDEHTEWFGEMHYVSSN